MNAIEDARALTVSGAQPHAIADLTRYAREMLGILEAEITNHHSMTVSGAREVLAQLRNRLAVLEKDGVGFALMVDCCKSEQDVSNAPADAIRVHRDLKPDTQVNLNIRGSECPTGHPRPKAACAPSTG